MHWHTVDYRKDGGARARVNVGFWLSGTSRLIPLCRLRGHKPVVDGVDYRDRSGLRSRWACCDRCGIRLLQPVDSDLEIGQPYTDPIPDGRRQPDDVTGLRGTVGGQLVLLGGHSGVSAQVKVGNAGSEHTLAAHLHLDRLGAIYLHTEAHGKWLQRRLNPTGYQSRVIELTAHDGRLWWQLWAKRDEHHRDDPWWMRGSVQVDPRTILWGPRRFSYTDEGEPVQAIVRMPHGDDHEVTLQLQRQSHGRRRLPSHARLSWMVEWGARPGIPTKRDDRGRILGSGVAVSDIAVNEGGWVEEACARIAARMTADRTRYGYRPAIAQSGHVEGAR